MSVLLSLIIDNKDIDSFDEIELFNINYLEIKNCPNITHIPSFEGVKIITLINMENLESIDDQYELSTLTCQNCPKLKELQDYPELEQIFLERCDSIIDINQSSDSIVSINIKKCKNISVISEFNNINTLTCTDMPKLRHILPSKNYISCLYIENCHNIEKIPFIKGLSQLCLVNCNNINYIDDKNRLDILQLYSIPIKNLPKINMINLNCDSCHNIIKLPKCRINHVSLNNCNNLEEIPIIYNKSFIDYYNCPSLLCIPPKCRKRSDILYSDFQHVIRKSKCQKMIYDIEEELIKRACHPKRIQSYLDIEELKFIGLYDTDISKYV